MSQAGVVAGTVLPTLFHLFHLVAGQTKTSEPLFLSPSQKPGLMSLATEATQGCRKLRETGEEKIQL